MRPRKTRFWRLVTRTVGAELALDRGERPELVGRDVAERGVGDGRHGALGGAAHDVGLRPSARTGRCALSATGVPWPIGGRRRRRRRRRPARRRLLRRPRGCRPATSTRPAGTCGVLEHPALQLVEAERVDDPLHAGPQLVVAVAGLVEDPQDRLDRRQQVLAWR